MLKTVETITESENEIHEIARRMATALPVSRMRDPHHPLTFVLTGGFNVGKSIFPDIIRLMLMDEGASMTGMDQYQQLWTGKRKGRDFQVAFMDAVYNTSGVSDFLSHRTVGGINFIQNLDPDLVRRLRHNVHMGIYVDRINIASKKPLLSLIGKFNSDAPPLDLSGRLVRFTVFDESLLHASAFRKFWNTFKSELSLPKTGL